MKSATASFQLNGRPGIGRHGFSDTDRIDPNSHCASTLDRQPRAAAAVGAAKSIKTCIVLLVLVLAAGLVRVGKAADEMSDTEKRAKIEAMYQNYKKDFPDVPDIEPAEAMRLMHEGKALFIDVREEKEQQVSMLPGAVTEKQFLKDPGLYRDRTLIAYCTISYRSGKLAERLKARGITLLNLKGGLLAWVHAGGKVYDHNGETKRIHVYGRKWNLAPKDYEAVW